MIAKKSQPRAKRKQGSTFGVRLATLRRAIGFTQVELGSKVNVSGRMIAHYENTAQYPPAQIIPLLAKVLKVSVEELLVLKPLKDEFAPKDLRKWRQLKKFERLAPKDQKAVLRFIQTLPEANQEKLV